MKQIGYKIDIEKNGKYKFVIFSNEGNIEKSPISIRTHEFSQSCGMYIYELLFENNHKEFFLENKGFVNGIKQGEVTIHSLDRMDNIEEFRTDYSDIFYKKNNKWYVYRNSEKEEDCITTPPSQ